jgi:hypothetical protein
LTIQKTLSFDGKTYEEQLDGKRLTGQHAKVYNAMKSSKWYTLYELEHATGCPGASVSARIRDFRKPKFGEHTVERRRRGPGGTWEYRLLLNKPSLI